MNISKDLELMLKKTGWTKTMLAKYVGVSRASIHAILTQEESDSVVDKLIPFVYGDKRPPDLPEIPDHKPKKPRKKKTEE